MGTSVDGGSSGRAGGEHGMRGVVAGAEGNAAGDGCAADSGDRVEAVEESAVELGCAAAGEGIFCRRRAELEGEQAVRLKAKLHALEVGERLQEKAGADEQDGGERQLEGGEPVAETRAGRTGEAASALAKDLAEVRCVSRAERARGRRGIQ